MQSHPVHYFIHDKCGACHIPRIFQYGKTEEHQENRRKECAHRLEPGSEAAGDQCHKEGRRPDPLQQDCRPIHEERSAEEVKEVDKRTTDDLRYPEHGVHD